MKKYLFLLLITFSCAALADAPPPPMPCNNAIPILVNEVAQLTELDSQRMKFLQCIELQRSQKKPYDYEFCLGIAGIPSVDEWQTIYYKNVDAERAKIAVMNQACKGKTFNFVPRPIYPPILSINR